MARVVYIPIPIGTSDSAAVNTIFGAIATQTGAADALNFGEEGLDKRALEANIQSERAFAPIVHNTVNTQALTAAFVTMDPGATVSFRTGPIALLANETLRVRFRGELLSDGTNFGLLLDTHFEVRLRWSVAAVPSVFASSLRRYHARTAPATQDRETRLDSFMRLVGPLSLDWVEVEVSDQSGNDLTVQFGRATLVGTIFKRVF